MPSIVRPDRSLCSRRLFNARRTARKVLANGMVEDSIKAAVGGGQQAVGQVGFSDPRTLIRSVSEQANYDSSLTLRVGVANVRWPIHRPYKSILNGRRITR